MNPCRPRTVVAAIVGLVVVGAVIFWRQNGSPDPSRVSLRFTGKIKWVDLRTRMADGNTGMQFNIKNDNDTPLCIAAMAANDSNVFVFNSVGFGLKPHSEAQFRILAPTSAIPWRVIVRCHEAIYVDPDKAAWDRIWTGLKLVFTRERYFFDKRGGTNFALVSGDF